MGIVRPRAVRTHIIFERIVRRYQSRRWIIPSLRFASPLTKDKSDISPCSNDSPCWQSSINKDISGDDQVEPLAEIRSDNLLDPTPQLQYTFRPAHLTISLINIESLPRRCNHQTNHCGIVGLTEVNMLEVWGIHATHLNAGRQKINKISPLSTKRLFDRANQIVQHS